MKHCLLGLLVGLSVWAAPGIAAPDADLVRMAASMDNDSGIQLEGAAQIVNTGPQQNSVLRAEAGFSGRIDLSTLGIDPRDYDLIKVEVEASRGAFLRFSLENYPNPGELAHWYVLDGMRGPFDWRTIWIDLKSPEEVKPPGYKGMRGKDPALRGLQFMGSIRDTRRRIQEPGHHMHLASVRFVKPALHVDWDQRSFNQRQNSAGDLLAEYPVTVTNRLARPITAKLNIVPLTHDLGHGTFAQSELSLVANETKTITANVTLPVAALAKMTALDSVFFEVRASVPSIADSEVTILRSADPIHLSVTVPPAGKTAPPYFTPPSKLPTDVVQFDEKMARDIVAAADVNALAAELLAKGKIRKVKTFMQVLVSAAFLYDFTGDRKYLDTVRPLLSVLPEVWQQQEVRWRSQPVPVISRGIVAPNTLSLGWRVGGTQRPPYLYNDNGSGRAGAMQSIAYVYDICYPALSKAFRDTFTQNFLLPVAIQARNHYFGPGNQQCTANVAALYGGLAAGNWPLVAFVYAAEHGLRGNIKWAYDDDGLCLEGHYQSYTTRPTLWATEMLLGVGVDLYDQRLYDIVHSRGAAAFGFGDDGGSFAQFLDQNRFANKPFMTTREQPKTDGHQLTGLTMLKWEDLMVAMNWGTHIFRSSHDRAAFWVRTSKNCKDKALRRLCVGGGEYNHSSFGQSVIIIDELIQNSVPATVTSVDIDGPVQHVTATSAKHYPGTTITRTFALLDRAVLVVDRVRSEQPRMVDWFLKGAGHEVSVPMVEKRGSFTAKPDDKTRSFRFGGGLSHHRRGSTNNTWNEGGGRLTMLAADNTQVFVFGDNKRTNMMVRREGVTNTTFVAFLSEQTAAIESLPVTRANGAAANAVGLQIKLTNGETFQVLVNDEQDGAVLSVGTLSSAEHFATNHKGTL